MREKNLPFMTRVKRFAEHFERVTGAAIIAASVLLVAPAMASEQAVDDSFSMNAGVHVTSPFILDGFDPVDLAELDAVRGAGLSPDGQSDFESGQQIGVILWDELKRNKLGQPDGGGASVTGSSLSLGGVTILTTAN